MTYLPCWLASADGSPVLFYTAAVRAASGATLNAVNADGAAALHLAAGGARLWAQHPLLAAAATE